MNLGLHYKNQDHIFDEKDVNGVPFLSYPMLEETGIMDSQPDLAVSAKDAGQR